MCANELLVNDVILKSRFSKPATTYKPYKAHQCKPLKTFDCYIIRTSMAFAIMALQPHMVWKTFSNKCLNRELEKFVSVKEQSHQKLWTILFNHHQKSSHEPINTTHKWHRYENKTNINFSQNRHRQQIISRTNIWIRNYWKFILFSQLVMAFD